MIRRFGLLLLSVFAVAGPLCAQHERDNLYMGNGYMFRFVGGKPVMDSIAKNVGSATVSVSNRFSGRLEFIANWDTVYNRNLLPMPNGGIGPNGATFSIRALPVPGDDSSWFLFIAKGLVGDESGRGLYVNRIDMRGDSGRGVVVQKNIAVSAKRYDDLCIVSHSDGYHYWLIAVGQRTNPRIDSNCYSFLIGPDGPCASPVVSFLPMHVWGLRASNNGRLLCDGKTLYNFDPGTGKITFERFICDECVGGSMSSVFSPNDKVLYVGDGWKPLYTVRQIDLTKPPTPFDSAYSVTDSGDDLILGPDGKVYGETAGYTDIYRIFTINSPDSLGAKCNFRNNLVVWNDRDGSRFDLSAWRSFYEHVPRLSAYPPLPQIASTRFSTCDGSCMSFALSDSVTGYPHWLFERADPLEATGVSVSNVCFDTAGAHLVRAILSSGDTVTTLVSVPSPSGTVTAQRDTAISARAGSRVAVPLIVKLTYSNAIDTIGHLFMECILTYDPASLLLTSDSSIMLPLGYEIYSLHQTPGRLDLVVVDTTYPSWMDANFDFRRNVDLGAVRFSLRPGGWARASVRISSFVLRDEMGEYSFCPQEDGLTLATIMQSGAGVALPTYFSRFPKLQVYPNPVSHEALICLDELPAGEAFFVEVVDAKGAHVATIFDAVSEADLGICYRLDCSNLSSGTYLVRVANDWMGKTVKFIKK